MLMENNSNYKLSFKTGLGNTPSGNQLGWMVGWIEENNHAYFFVLQVETPDQTYNMKENRIALLKKILKKYGFMEGRK
jgi:beta-lactamase class D